jgi:pseudaminic acid cytidylyltransferase
MIVAIIPARGGSKRIPRKNIRPFAGQPMIAHTIAAARETGLFDRIVVSTDDAEIAEVARAAGAEVPFVRDAEISGDHAGTAEVIIDAVVRLRRDGPVTHACCIYATAPFVRPQDIRTGYQTLIDRGVGGVFSVTTFAFPIFRALSLGKDGRLSMFWPEHRLTRSNDLPEAYHDAGQFYWVDADRLLAEKTLYLSDAMPVIIPRWRVQDIDTPEDWETAERMFEAQRGRR